MRVRVRARGRARGRVRHEDCCWELSRSHHEHLVLCPRVRIESFKDGTFILEGADAVCAGEGGRWGLGHFGRLGIYLLLG